MRTLKIGDKSEIIKAIFSDFLMLIITVNKDFEIQIWYIALLMNDFISIIFNIKGFRKIQITS